MSYQARSKGPAKKEAGAKPDINVVLVEKGDDDKWSIVKDDEGKNVQACAMWLNEEYGTYNVVFPDGSRGRGYPKDYVPKAGGAPKGNGGARSGGGQRSYGQGRSQGQTKSRFDD